MQVFPLSAAFSLRSNKPASKFCHKAPNRSFIVLPAVFNKIRLSPAQKQSIESDRLLLLSPFSASYSRATTELAEKRNEMIGAIAHTIVMTYAAPGSKTLFFAQRLIKAGKSVLTLNSLSNSLLQEQGIAGLDANAIVQCCLGSQNSTSQ